MFDAKATRAWWEFFHRFSQIYQGENFDTIVILGIKLLQCETCQNDAGPFYKTIGRHKTPFEKIHILHNYVNRKLKKKIYTLNESRKYANDIWGRSQQIQWEVFLKYYFNLLFLMSKYITPGQLDDLKEFSAHVYNSLNVPKRITQNAIQVASKQKVSREQIQLQTFDYYNKTLSALRNINVPFQNYQMVYGQTPKKQRVCSACAKRHRMYMERHQMENNKQQKQPKSKPRVKPTLTPLGAPKRIASNKPAEKPKPTPTPKPVSRSKPVTRPKPTPISQIRAIKPTVVNKPKPKAKSVKNPTVSKLPSRVTKPAKPPAPSRPTIINKPKAPTPAPAIASKTIKPKTAPKLEPVPGAVAKPFQKFTVVPKRMNDLPITSKPRTKPKQVVFPRPKKPVTPVVNPKTNKPLNAMVLAKRQKTLRNVPKKPIVRRGAGVGTDRRSKIVRRKK